MKKELSSEDITELFAFVKSKNVRYVDVQHEIVDHLASAIEEEMENNEHSTFRTALHNVYSKFPITGFVHFVDQKDKGLRSYWRKRLFNYLLDYMKFPKILLLISLCIVNFYLVQMLNPYGLIIMLSFYWLFTIYIVLQNRKFFKSNNIAEDDFLVIKIFKSIVYNISLPPLVLFYFSDSLDFFSPQVVSTNFGIVISIVLALMGIWNLACLTDFPKMLKEEMEQKYRHLDISVKTA